MWTTIKPKLTHECLLLTIKYYNDLPNPKMFVITKIVGEDYLALTDEDGYEWCAYEDFEADLYQIVELPEKR